MNFYTITIIISIIILIIAVTWKSNKNITIKKIENKNEKILKELRHQFLEAQKSGADRIAHIDKLRNEVEQFIQDEEEDETTY